MTDSRQTRNGRDHLLAWLARLAAMTAIVVAAAVAGLSTGPERDAEAATVIVRVGERDGRPGDKGNEYNPNTVAIVQGDTVRWDWFDGTHNVTPAFATEPAATSITHFNSSGDTYSWTFNNTGTFWYYCTLHAELRDIDTNENGVIDGGDSPEFGKMIGRVDVAPVVSDTTGPITSGVAASPNPTNGAASVTVTATANDTTTGGSNIAAAEYFIDTLGAPGTGTPMAASDGSFSSVSEGVTASANVGGLSLGLHNIFVQARDSAGNWGGADVVVLDVTSVPPGAEVARINILGGALSVTTAPVAFGVVSLLGVDLIVDTQPAAWNATDARGSGAGWNVTLTATDFTSPGGTIAVGNFKMKLDGANVVTIGGNTPPTSQATTYQPLDSATPLKLMAAAAGAGMGAYDFTPDARLTVPAETAPGTYESFMTVSINSGP